MGIGLVQMGDENKDRLESWKEIAGFIGRSQRTAMRWAKRRGMPVSQLPGGKGGGVYASRADIAEWMGMHPKPESEPEVENTLRPTTLHRDKMWMWISATVLAVLILGLILATSSKSILRTGLPTQVKFRENGFDVFDGSNRELWSHSFSQRLDGSILARSQPLEDLVRIDDFRGDGAREVLVVAPLRNGANPDDLFRVEVDMFSRSGTLLWSYVPQKSLQFGDHTLQGPWNIYDVFVSNQGSKKTIWISAIHYVWGNSFIAQIDPSNGKETVRFVNSGIIYKLNEMHTSRGTYLVAEGFNNEYDSGIVAIIDESKPFAASPQTAGTRHQCVSCQPGNPDYYLVFPRTEINQLEKFPEDPVRRVNVTEEGIEVFKSEVETVKGAKAIYSLRVEPAIEPVSLRYDTDYDMLHRELSTQKKLNHSLEDCPERLHPKPVRMWTPTGGWTELHFKSAKASD
jgi:hypothetical protein